MCLRFFITLTLLLVTCGCNSKGLARVHGQVTLDGKAVSQAMVQFVPDTPGLTGGRMPHAYTDQDGSFTMTTQDFGDGVRPGSYKVVVTKHTGPASMGATPVPRQDSDGEEGGDPPQERLEIMKGMLAAPARPKSELPAIYADAATTPLRAEISKGGKTDILLELKSSEK